MPRFHNVWGKEVGMRQQCVDCGEVVAGLNQLTAHVCKTGPESPTQEPRKRTRQEVIEARNHAVTGGCCDRFADNMACDCLEEAEPDAAPCLTPADVDEIERKVAELYRLYNVCAEKGLRWNTPYREVRDLMNHLDAHFPGFYALQLIAEVRFLQRRVIELTSQLQGKEDLSDPGTTT